MAKAKDGSRATAAAQTTGLSPDGRLSIWGGHRRPGPGWYHYPVSLREVDSETEFAVLAGATNPKTYCTTHCTTHARVLTATWEGVVSLWDVSRLTAWLEEWGQPYQPVSVQPSRILEVGYGGLEVLPG